MKKKTDLDLEVRAEINFSKYSNKKLENFIWQWENLIETRSIIPFSHYALALKESYERFNDNSFYKIGYFSENKTATIEDFMAWFKEI